MRFGLRQGPWATIFSGLFQGHETEMLLNPQNFLLVAVFEKEGELVSGILLQVFAVFNAAGEMGAFVETMDRETIVLSRHNGKQTINFLAFASKPAYSRPNDEEAARTVDELIGQAQQGVSVVIDVARAYDLHLTELDKCSSEVKAAFFAQPLIVPLVSSEKKQAVETGLQEQPAPGLGPVMLGVSREGKQVVEPLLLFKKTIVSGGTPEERRRFMHIIVESGLLSSVPAVIFDSGNSFTGLNAPNGNAEGLRNYGSQLEPIGFPMAVFSPPKQAKVNLNWIDPNGMMQLLGCNDSEINSCVANAIKEGKPQNTQQLLETLDSLGKTSDAGQFSHARAARIVRLGEEMYPELLGGENNAADLSKKWLGCLGRANIISLAGMDTGASLLLAESVCSELLHFFREQGETSGIRAMVVVPEAEKFLPLAPNTSQQHLLNVFAVMQKYGMAFLAGTEREIGLHQKISGIAVAKAGIIKENDASIQLEGKKSYRVLLRPGLSTMR